MRCRVQQTSQCHEGPRSPVLALMSLQKKQHIVQHEDSVTSHREVTTVVVFLCLVMRFGGQEAILYASTLVLVFGVIHSRHEI